MKRIVILGGGYAGVNAAKALEKNQKREDEFEIVLINRTENHIMMTSLHEVAGGRVGKDAVKLPLNDIFKSGKVRLIIDEALDIDFTKRELSLQKHPTLRYDHLILATGSVPTYFGIEGAKEHSLPLWSLDHAVTIRRFIIESFRSAAEIRHPGERKQLLSFMVAGGGFTGIEFAGELGEWKNKLCRTYGIDPGEVSVKVLEACPKILPNLDQVLIDKAVKKLKDLGVEVLTDSKIVRVEPDCVILSDGMKLSGKMIWSAGIQGNEMNGHVDIRSNARLRIPVDDCMNSCYREVYCIGDSVYFEENGKAIPQIVETALQTSDVAAENILADIRNGGRKGFRSNYHGTMVSIGSGYGVAKISNLKLYGKAAILMKHLVNIHYFMGLGSPGFIREYLKHQLVSMRYKGAAEPVK